MLAPNRNSIGRQLTILLVLTKLYMCAGASEAGETKPQLLLPLGHTATVNSAALSGNGKRVVTGADNGRAIFWDADTGKSLHVFKRPKTMVTSVALSETGKQVLVGSDDKVAVLWDGDTGKPLQTFKRHTSSVQAVALSDDGNSVLTGSADQTAILWDAKSAKPLHIFKGHIQEIRCVALSRDGKWVITGSNDSIAILWDAETGNRLRTFKGHTGEITCVAVSGDGNYVLTGSIDRTAILWNAQTGNPLHTWRAIGKYETMRSVALSEDGKRALIGSFDFTATLRDTLTGKHLQAFKGVLPVTSVAMSRDGKRILAGYTNRDSSYEAAELWDASTTNSIQRFQAYALLVTSVSMSGDGKRIATASFTKGAIIWDVELGKPLPFFVRHTDSVFSVALSRDGKRLVTGSRDKTAILWDADNGQPIQILKGHNDMLTSVAFGATAKRILTAALDGTTILWDGDSGKPLQTFKPKGDSYRKFTSVAMSRDGTRFVTRPQYTPPATMWNAETGNVLHTFVGDSGTAYSVALSEDGKRVLVGGRDKVVLWDADTRDPLKTFIGHTDAVTSVALSANGKYVLSGSIDDTAILWDADTAKPINTFKGHQGAITSVAFGPTDSFFLTASMDGTVRIWKPGRDEPVFSFLLAHPYGEWLFWTPEGYYTCSPNGESLIAWKVGDDSPQGYRIVGPEQFRKQFHRPDLFRHLLRELDLGKALAAADLENSRQPTKSSNIAEALPPYVIIARPLNSGEIIKTEECEISAKAKSVGDNYVASLQLMIDGRPHEGGRTKFIIREPKAGEASATWKAILAPGKRRIQVVAESIKGSTSQSEEIVIIRADEPEALPKLLVLSVGISAYTKADRKGVEYAAADAKRFLDAQLAHSNDLYTDAEKIPLITGDASKADILDAFDVLSKKARESKNAVTLIFLAGHGKVNEMGDFYFLAADSDPKKLRATAISGAELKDALRNVPGRVVVFLDACHSGAIAGDKYRTPLTEDLFRDLTSAECGVVMICSSRGNELSQQSNSQKVGYFTLAVVEGLAGKATKEKNGAVYLPDLFAYVARRVRELSDDRQHPYSSELIKIGNLPLTRP